VSAWSFQNAKGTNLPALVEILDPDGSVCMSVHGTNQEEADLRAAEIVKILQDRIDKTVRDAAHIARNMRKHEERMERREKRIHPNMKPIDKPPTQHQLRILESMLKYRDHRRNPNDPAIWHAVYGWHWGHGTTTDAAMVALAKRGVVKREMRYRPDGTEISPLYTAMPHAEEYYQQHKHILGKSD
jgi:hypothetical protein